MIITCTQELFCNQPHHLTNGAQFCRNGPLHGIGRGALFTFCDVWSKSDLNGIRHHILLFLTQRLQSLLAQWLQRQFRLWMVREPFFVQFHTRHAFSSVISNIWTFEDSFESTQWRKAKQMQPLVHPFEQHSRLTCPEEGGEGDGRAEEKDEWGKNSPHIFPARGNGFRVRKGRFKFSCTESM